MIAKYGGQCRDCFREILVGTEVGYRKGRGMRHLGCAPITTEELAAGRARFTENEARRAARKADADAPFARHDAANAAWSHRAARTAEAAG